MKSQIRSQNSRGEESGCNSIILSIIFSLSSALVIKWIWRPFSLISRPALSDHPWTAAQRRDETEGRPGLVAQMESESARNWKTWAQSYKILREGMPQPLQYFPAESLADRGSLAGLQPTWGRQSLDTTTERVTIRQFLCPANIFYTCNV